MLDFIKDKAGQLGGFLALIGLVSSVLSFFDYNLRILMWIDLWGTTMGWVIRIGLIIVGAFLAFVFNSNTEEKDDV